MDSVCNICTTRCMGFPGNKGGCCTVSDRDYIIGKHSDTKEFLDRLNKKFGKEFKYEEIFIDYEEGKKIFPEKSCWQNPKNYPCLRLDFKNPSHPCIFYNNHLGLCSIHEIRPITCAEYYCDYLENNFF